MIRALRVMTVERGVAPRELALMAFGGAGGLHAAAIAQELGITRILCPRASGVLAALGLVVSERRRDVQRSVLLRGDELTREAVDAAVEELAERAGGRTRVTYDLRYAGQAFELSVTHDEPEPAALRDAFEAEHERAYGYRDADAAVELVTIRVTAAEPGPEIDPETLGAGRGVERSTRTTTMGETTVLRGEPEPGEEIEGPAIVELPESTLVVPEGWSGKVEAAGTVRLWTR
jgi:N-methylhydantoinase A